MRNFLGNSLPPYQQELRYFQIAVVASDITNTIVQQDNLRLPITGVHVHPYPHLCCAACAPPQ